MVSCCAGEPGSFLRKPMTDENGQMVSRAPVWYMEAMGWIPDWTPLEKQITPSTLCGPQTTA
jgi:hypothetical protein